MTGTILDFGFNGPGTSFDNVLLEHRDLRCVIFLVVHPDLGHLSDTQGYFELLSEPCTPTRPSKSYGVVLWGGVVGVVLGYQQIQILGEVWMQQTSNFIVQ